MKENNNDFNYGKIKEQEKKYESEVEQEWGGTETYIESKKRTTAYTEEDYKKILEESGQLIIKLAELYKEGRKYDHPEVQEVVKQIQGHISKYFYECTDEIYSELGQMYEQDERFAVNYETHAKGLSSFFNKAIQHYVKVKEV